MTLSANILFSLVANETDAVDFAKDVRTTKVEEFVEFTDGTGANQAQVVWSDKGTVSPGDSVQIHSSAGMAGFADERGSINFSAIKVIYFKNTGSSTVGLAFQDWAAGVPFGAAEFSFREGDSVCFVNKSATGFVTTDGVLFVQNLNVSAPATYEIVLIGEGTIT